MMTFAHRVGNGMPPLYSTNYPLRIFVSLRALVVALIAMFEVNTVSHKLLVAGEPFGALEAMLLLAMLGVVGVADAVINDILPDRYTIRPVAAHRHLLFLAIATIQIGFMLIVVVRGYRGTALLALGLDATAAIWIAIYHIRHRYMVPRAEAIDEGKRRWSDRASGR